MSILKRIAAIFIGLMVAFTVIILLEKVAHGNMIVPEGVDPNTPEGAAKLIADAPVSALLWVVAGYLFGTFLGSVIAQLISNGNKPISAYITGCILLLLTLANLFMVAHPTWMIVASLIAVAFASWLAGRLITKKTNPV